MHKGKKHTESSYQPIKDKSGKVILTSEQARNVDEDFPSNDENSHEFDHKPSQTDVKQADFINSKMRKMRKESQSRKAVTDLNKVIDDIKKSPMSMLGMGVSRCWKGYKPNPDGRPASEKGSCVKK